MNPRKEEWNFDFVGTKIDPPCKGCDRRSQECHGVCPKYQEYLDAHSEEALKLKKKAYIDGLCRRTKHGSRR